MFRTIQLSKSDPTPLYIQLASELATLIQEDVLKEGFKLPTIRLLSKQLAINRDTVVSAYKLLEQQGLVESHIGKGTYIAAHPLDILSSSYSEDISSPQLCCSQLKLSSDFFPPTLCETLTHDIIAHEGWEAFSDPFLRYRCLLKQSIASYFHTLGIKTHFAQIKITSDFNTFLLTLFKFFPKIGICVETPRDLSISCKFRSFGSKIYEIPLVDDGLDLDYLEKILRTGTISYIVTSPYVQNPTGLCYSLENKKALLSLATAYDCYIIEDGSYCDFLNPNLHYQPLFNLCNDHRVIYMYPFSRLYLPHMKYYFFIVPPLFNTKINDDSNSNFNERFLHYYLDSDFFSTLKSNVLALMLSHSQKLQVSLSDSPHPLQLTTLDSTLFLWLKITSQNPENFLRYLSENRLIVAPGELFSTLPLSNYLRLSVGELTSLQLEQILKIITSYSE